MHEEIFPSQGKYTIDILKRFTMLDYKFMATPMDANLKKLRESASDFDLIPPCIVS